MLEADTQTVTSRTKRADRWRATVSIAVVCVVILLAAALMLARSPLINGVSYWRWHYQTTQVSLGWVALVSIAVAALCAWARSIHASGRTATSLAFLALAGIVLRLATAWLFSREVTLRFIDYVVRNPVVGSYFTVAEKIDGRSDILTSYPKWMAHMPLHAMNKPPGLALFNLLFIDALGNRAHQETAAMVGLACGALSLLCIPLLYIVVHDLGGSARAGFHAAALWSLCPAAAIFFPLFDPLLTVPALLLAITWMRAMRDDRFAWSAAMGVVLATTLFCTFNVLPIGFYLAAIGLFAATNTPRARLKRFVVHAAVVAAVAGALHGGFWLATGFDLIATLRAALANQAELLKGIDRPYPATIWGDLVDFSLGLAWVPVVLAAAYLTRLRRPLRLIDFAVIVGLLQLLVMAASALLPGETSRVWNFLTPLVLIPAALELDRWPRWSPVIAYAGMALLTALLSRSMIFMWAG